MNSQRCFFGTCDVCNNIEFAIVEQNGLLIDLRKLRKSNSKMNNN